MKYHLFIISFVVVAVSAFALTTLFLNNRQSPAFNTNNAQQAESDQAKASPTATPSASTSPQQESLVQTTSDIDNLLNDLDADRDFADFGDLLY